MSVPSTPPDFVDQTSLLDWMYTPTWAGGWTATRYLWVLAAVLEHGWRVRAIEESFCAPDMVFVNSSYRVAEYFVCTPTIGYGLWVGLMAGIGLVLYGGRLTKPGLLLWAVCAWTLMGHESLMIKAHDRLLTWIAIGMMLSPLGERDLGSKYRSPAGRIWMLITFCGIYGSTGIDKAIHEPSWFNDGDVLGYHFLEVYFGNTDLGVWLSDKWFLLWPATIITVLWEALFPFLIWFKRLSPWVLLVGALFHLSILGTMHVGPFLFVSMSAYPVLLHPEVGREWYTRWLQWRADR